MPEPILSLGMASYDDFRATAMTIRALTDMHDVSRCELIVVNNKKDDPYNKALQDFTNNQASVFNCVQYIEAPEVTGTSAPREIVMTRGRAKYAACMDCHVHLLKNSVADLIAYYEKYPDTLDLLTGPLDLDHHRGINTHFADEWGGQMWGRWGTAWTGNGRQPFYVRKGPDGNCTFWTLQMNPEAFTMFTPLPYGLHENALREQGYRVLGSEPTDVFEIPGQGLGFFTCAKDAWLHFHPQAQGFGGEEMYIHEKFRKAGRKCLCCGFMPWWHLFTPEGITPPYPISMENKVINNILHHQELDIPLDRCRAEFVGNNYIAAETFDAMVENPTAPVTKEVRIIRKEAEQPATLEQCFDIIKERPRDLNEHMPLLRAMASNVCRVTEFSNRRESTIAFLAANPDTLISYNPECGDAVVTHMAERLVDTEVTFVANSAPGLSSIELTDLLFLDTIHTKDYLSKELALYAPAVTRYIMMHDTQIYGERGDGGGLGLVVAIREFLHENPNWFIVAHDSRQYGLTVLGCDPRDKPAYRLLIWDPGYGAGFRLKKIIESFGVTPEQMSNCGCNALAANMNMNGTPWVRQYREDIAKTIENNFEKWKWVELDSMTDPNDDDSLPVSGKVKRSLKERLITYKNVLQSGYAKRLAFSRNRFLTLVDIAIEEAEKEWPNG